MLMSHVNNNDANDGNFDDTLSEILGASSRVAPSLNLDLAFGTVDSNVDPACTPLLSLLSAYWWLSYNKVFSPSIHLMQKCSCALASLSLVALEEMQPLEPRPADRHPATSQKLLTLKQPTTPVVLALRLPLSRSSLQKRCSHWSQLIDTLRHCRSY